MHGNKRLDALHFNETRNANVRETGDGVMRNLSEFEIGLKRALRQAVERAGGCVRVADTLGLSQSVVSNYYNEADNSRPPIWFIHSADMMAAEPFCTQYIAASLGYDLVAQKTTEVEREEALVRVADCGDAHNSLESFAIRSLADGRLSQNEKNGLRERIAKGRSCLRAVEELTA